MKPPFYLPKYLTVCLFLWSCFAFGQKQDQIFQRPVPIDSTSFSSLNMQQQYVLLMDLEDAYDHYHKKDLPKQQVLNFLSQKTVYWRGEWVEGESGMVKRFLPKRKDLIAILDLKSEQ